jgi:hypothetical protein
LARPITRENLGDLAGVLDQVLAADTQRNPERRWWPEGRSALEDRDEARPHDRDAPLFAVSNKR